MIPSDLSNPENVANVSSPAARKHWARKHESPYPNGSRGGGGLGKAGFNTGPKTNRGLLTVAAAIFLGCWSPGPLNYLWSFFWDKFDFAYALDWALVQQIQVHVWATLVPFRKARQRDLTGNVDVVHNFRSFFVRDKRSQDVGVDGMYKFTRCFETIFRSKFLSKRRSLTYNLHLFLLHDRIKFQVFKTVF
jgi:hypothetical protein